MFVCRLHHFGPSRARDGGGVHGVGEMCFVLRIFVGIQSLYVFMFILIVWRDMCLCFYEKGRGKYRTISSPARISAEHRIGAPQKRGYGQFSN